MKKNFFTNTNGNLEYNFISPISIDNGFINSFIGEFNCSMELFTDDNKTPHSIEWIVNDGQEVQNIGLYFEGKSLIDYDGVFELPIQAVELINKAGFLVDDSFSDDFIYIDTK